MGEIGVKEIAKLTAMISTAGLDPTKWQDFVDHLHIASGGVRVHVSGLDFRSDVYLGITSAGYDPDWLNTYDAYYGEKNAWMNDISGKATGVTYHLKDLWEREELERSEFYNDWIRPQEDIMGGGASMLFNDNSRMFVLGGNIRRRDLDRLEHSWLQLAETLTPHLMNALEVNRLLAGKSLEAYALDRHASTARTAVFAINSGRHVLLANATAQSLLETGDVVRCDHLGRMSFCGASETAFQQALQSLQQDGAFLPRTFEVRQTLRGTRHLCRICAVKPEELDHTPTGVLIGVGETALLITLTPLAAPAAVRAQLCAQYALSPMESRIALMIGAGLSVAEIALDNGTSVNTVRNQLKSAMSKLGVHKQLELARIVEHASVSLR